LDIGPAINGVTTVGRVWIEKETPIEAELTLEQSGSTTGTGSVAFELRDVQGKTHHGGPATFAAPTVRASSRAAATGWHEIVLTATGMPPAGAPFEFKIEYTAPQTLAPEEF
jgi:hypothetical protein